MFEFERATVPVRGSFVMILINDAINTGPWLATTLRPFSFERADRFCVKINEVRTTAGRNDL